MTTAYKKPPPSFLRSLHRLQQSLTQNFVCKQRRALRRRTRNDNKTTNPHTHVSSIRKLLGAIFHGLVRLSSFQPNRKSTQLWHCARVSLVSPVHSQLYSDRPLILYIDLLVNHLLVTAHGTCIRIFWTFSTDWPQEGQMCKVVLKSFRAVWLSLVPRVLPRVFAMSCFITSSSTIFWNSFHSLVSFWPFGHWRK